MPAPTVRFISPPLAFPLVRRAAAPLAIVIEPPAAAPATELPAIAGSAVIANPFPAIEPVCCVRELTVSVGAVPSALPASVMPVTADAPLLSIVNVGVVAPFGPLTKAAARLLA